MFFTTNKSNRYLRAVAGSILLALTLAACGTTSQEASTEPENAEETTPLMKTAVANLMNDSGAEIGTVRFTETGNGVEMAVKVNSLEPEMHAIHIHEGEACTPPDFTSAGGHFNPNMRSHGKDSKGGPHLGDLDNFEVAAAGTSDFTRTVVGGMLENGDHSILGRAVVIHAGADDYMSQPSGDAGGRVACGIIVSSSN